MRTFALFIVVTCMGCAAFGQSDAKTNFSTRCAVCHGADAKAQTAMAKKMGSPDLTSAPIQKQPDAELRKAIADGKGKMPPYGGLLGKDGVDAMVKYVRSLAATK